MLHRSACYLGLVLIHSAYTLAAEPAPKAQEEKQTAAVKAAESWLKLVDEGKYAESWQQAAPYFQKAVQQEQLEQALQGIRKPLGELATRKVKSATYKTSLPGAPDGEYFILQFETSLKNKQQAIETVTPMLDKDGTWRVSGYFIK